MRYYDFLILVAAVLLFAAAFAIAGIPAVSNGPVIEAENNIVWVLSGKTDTGDSGIFAVHPKARTISAKVVGTGAVSATVIVYVSNTGASNDWIAAGTISLSGTTSDAAGFALDAKWAYMKANVSAISGTGAAVTVTMGV